MAEIQINLLEVDLTTETSRVVDVTEHARKYIGGRGLGSKLLWDLVPQGADPLGPENILHLGIGPITGVQTAQTSCSFLSRHGAGKDTLQCWHPGQGQSQ